MKTICLLLLMASLGYAQQATKPSMQAESAGKCSPNILANQGQVRFVCNASMDRVTAAKIVTLLNRILQQQGTNEGNGEINAKLDEILGFLKREAEAHEQRQLPIDQLEAVKQLLSAHPAKIRIFYSQNDSEAYQLAKQISEILVGSGWTLTEPVTGVLSFVEGGAPPLYGMSLAYRGDKPERPGAQVHIDPSTPVGVLTNVLMHFFRDGFVVDPAPTNSDEFLQLIVFPNPKSKPPSVQGKG
ncbi:MAG: hypothetical protein LAP86_27725 [Acidobacteriia bacterium]|nr:hypothetical protein [Terriglobia bacterium]